MPNYKYTTELKIGLSNEEKVAIENRVSDNTLKKTYSASPDQRFNSVKELTDAYPNGEPIESNAGYQRPKLVPNLEGKNEAYIYLRTELRWANMGEWNGFDNAIKIKVTTPIFSIETAEYIANYIKNNYDAIQDYKQLVVFVETETITTIYTGYITTFKGGTAQDYEFTIFGGYNERQSKYYYGDTTGGLTNDRTYYELDDTLKYKYDNYQTGVDKANNYLDNQTKQSLQDLRLDNHNDRLNNLEDIIHETIDTEVEEKFTGNKWNVPTSAEVGGKNYKVVDNQLFKISGIVGKTRKSNNLLKLKPIDTFETAGVHFDSLGDGKYKIYGTSTDFAIRQIMQPSEFTPIVGETYEYKAFPENSNLIMLINFADEKGQDNYVSKVLWKEGYTLRPFVLQVNPQKTINGTFGIMLAKGEAQEFEAPFEGLQSTTISNITSTNKEGVQVDTTKTIKLTLKGAGNVGDEAIVTRTLDTMGQPTELFEVDEITRMGEVDLGTLTFGWTGSLWASNRIEDMKENTNEYGQPNIVSSKYETLRPYDIEVKSKGISNFLDKRIWIYDNNYTSTAQTETFNESLKGIKLIYELATPINKPKVKNLTLGDVSVLGQKGGEFQVNPIEPNIVEPKETRMKFDIKFWQEPTGGK